MAGRGRDGCGPHVSRQQGSHLVGCLCVGYGSEGASEPLTFDLSFPPDLFVLVALPVVPFGFGFAFPAGEEVLEAA